MNSVDGGNPAYRQIDRILPNQSGLGCDFDENFWQTKLSCQVNVSEKTHFIQRKKLENFTLRHSDVPSQRTNLSSKKTWQ